MDVKVNMNVVDCLTSTSPVLAIASFFLTRSAVRRGPSFFVFFFPFFFSSTDLILLCNHCSLNTAITSDSCNVSV